MNKLMYQTFETNANEMFKNCKAKWLGCVLTGNGSSMEKGGRREIKVREAGEQGTGGGRFSSPCPPYKKWVTTYFIASYLYYNC